MDEESLGQDRPKGGRPREIPEEALRGRYGQAGVDLVVLLYSLAEEAGFTNIAAARRWVELDPDGARKHGVLKDSGIQPRRLSEAVRMVFGPVPVGLVKTFLDLWAGALPATGSQARVRRVTERVAALRRKVVAAHERPPATSSRLSRSAAAVARAEAEKLKDELLRVQDDLIRTQNNETRFRNLSSVLFIALTQLQDTHRRLVRERDDLRARAEASAAVEADARTAGDQLARAQRQLDQARARTAEAEELAEDLRARYAELHARLAETDTADTGPTPPATPPERSRTGTVPGGGSLAEYDATLDRVEDLLAECGLDLDQTRDRLANDDTEHDDTEYDEPGVVRPESAPDIPPTWPYSSDNPTPNLLSDAHLEEEARTLQDLDEGSEHQVGWPPRSGPDLDQDLGDPAPRIRPRATNGPRQPSNYVHPAAPRPGKARLIRSARLDGPFRIAVLGLKGGVGRTTLTLCLGALFAELRAEHVIAVDIDPNHGNLAHRLPRETTATVRHLLRVAHKITTHDLARVYTSRSPFGLEVLASDPDPAVSENYTAHNHRDTLRLLERFYGIVITDCGTSLTHPAMPAVLEQSDALLLVSSCSVDGAQTSAATLDRLEALGHGHLLPRTVTAINLIGNASGRIDVDKLAAHFASRCHSVVCVPDDPHLAEGTELEPGRLARGTRSALRDLAVDLLDVVHIAGRVTAPVTSPVPDLPPTVAPDTLSPTPDPPPPTQKGVVPREQLLELLAPLDRRLAEGRITADDYRRRRNEILDAALQSEARLSTRQEELDRLTQRMNRRVITPAEYEREARWVIDNPQLYPPGP